MLEGLETDTELRLVARLQAGEVAALELLIARYDARLYRVAYQITRNEADAQEVVQDAFLTVVRKIHTFEGRAALSSWLYRVAANAALIKRRARREDREVPLEPELPAFLPDGHRAGNPRVLATDWSQTPEASVQNQQTREILQRAIDRLPDRYRTVLILRDVEGLSNEAIAAAIGDTVGAVKSRLHRARMSVREELTRHLGPQPYAAVRA